MSRFVLFSKRDLFEVIRNSEDEINAEIDRYDYQKVNMPIDDLTEEIYQSYARRTPVLQVENITQIENGEKLIEHRGGERRVTFIKIEVPFSGDSELLSCRPSQFTLVAIEAEVYEDKIHLLYAIDGRTSEEIRKEIDGDLADINDFLKHIESDLTKFHSRIKELARRRIELRKEKLNKNKQVVEGLGFPIKKG